MRRYTGGIYNFENYDKLPRLTVVMMARSFPKLIDARFMHYDQFSYDESSLELFKFLNTLFDSPESLGEEEHLAYKYLILVDGNTCAWNRIPWIMLSNSVLLK